MKPAIHERLPPRQARTKLRRITASPPDAQRQQNAAPIQPADARLEPHPPDADHAMPTPGGPTCSYALSHASPWRESIRAGGRWQHGEGRDYRERRLPEGIKPTDWTRCVANGTADDAAGMTAPDQSKQISNVNRGWRDRCLPDHRAECARGGRWLVRDMPRIGGPCARLCAA